MVPAASNTPHGKEKTGSYAPCPVQASPWHWHLSGARSAGVRPAGTRRRSRAGLGLPGPAHLALHASHTHLTALCREAEAVRTLPRGRQKTCRSGWRSSARQGPASRVLRKRTDTGKQGWSGRKSVHREEGGGLHPALGPGAKTFAQVQKHHQTVLFQVQVKPNPTQSKRLLEPA